MVRQSLIMSHGSFSIFVTRPISAGFFVVAIFLLVSPLISVLKKGPKEERLIDLE
jgi:TctA family transporter